MSLFKELKRRNVFRVGLAYVVSAWIVAQVASLVLDSIEAPVWVMQVLLLMLGLGFIVALIIAWAYELTPEGIKKEKDVERDDSVTNITAKKLDYITLAGVLLVVVLFVYQQMNPTKMDPHLRGNDVDGNKNNALIVKTPVIPAKAGTSSSLPDSKVEHENDNVINDKSIAVLPFLNMSSDKDQEYFADGISEEILNALVKATGLRVAGRTSSFSFKGKDDTIKEIGATLKVAYVLEGSVRKQNQNVRITAQLIKADDGFHLWSETYDGSLDNIFDLQEEISRKVTNELKVLLDLNPNQRLASKMTYNIDAYDLYLRGREKVRKRIANNIPEGIVLLQQAVELDPNFAHAWAKLAEAEAVSSGYISVDYKLANARALKYLDKAKKLNNNLALPHAINGVLSLDQGDYLLSIAHYNKALTLEPNNTIALRWLAIAYTVLGYVDRALPIYQQAYTLDPLSSTDTYNFASVNFQLGNIDQAIRFFELTGDLRGGFQPELASVYDHHGESQKAIELFLNGIESTLKVHGLKPLANPEHYKIFALGAFSGSKEQQEAARKLGKIVISGPDDQFAWQLLNHLAIDNIDRVFEILEGKPDFFLDFAADTMWLPLKGNKKFRADPRFITLMQKHKLPEAWQKLGWPKYCQPNKGTDGSDGQFQCH